MKEKLTSFTSGKWTQLIVALLVISTVLTSLFFRLGNIVSGFAPQEIIVKSQSSSISSIINNPINAPYKLVQFALIKANLQSPFFMRLVSVLFSIIMLVLIYWVIKQWSSRRVATLSILLLATSSWFLNNARIATTNIILPLGITLLLSIILWQKKIKKPKTTAIVSILLVGLLFYVPGLIWFIVPLIIWQLIKIKQNLTKIPIWYVLLSALFFILLLSPLIYATVKDMSLARTLLGIPTNFAKPLQILQDLVSVPISLFIRSTQSPYLWLSPSAILDIFTSAMIILGGYSLFYYSRSNRSLFIFAGFIIGSILYSLQGSIDLIITMPLLYVTVALGLSQMLFKWFTVFPKNPFARSIGSTLVTGLVVLACFYGLSRYFVAWPNAQLTKQAFTNQQK